MVRFSPDCRKDTDYRKGGLLCIRAVIVDDEPVIVSGIRDALDWEGFGFEIALATTSPATVLSFLSVHPVHLLITDISMPEMDGIEVIKNIRRDSCSSCDYAYGQGGYI